jgi:hypothetical protein
LLRKRHTAIASQLGRQHEVMPRTRRTRTTASQDHTH